MKASHIRGELRVLPCVCGARVSKEPQKCSPREKSQYYTSVGPRELKEELPRPAFWSTLSNCFNLGGEKERPQEGFPLPSRSTGHCSPAPKGAPLHGLNQQAPHCPAGGTTKPRGCQPLCFCSLVPAPLRQPHPHSSFSYVQ